MTVWKFEKTAGLVLDQQDDPGVIWEKIASYWPDELDHPEIGIEADKGECIANLTDGHEKIARYPTDTPENTLASSMYFVHCGLDHIEKKAHEPIAEGLQNARVAWGVELPDGFTEFVKHAHAPQEQEEVFADDGEYLPVTTPEQCSDSIRVFEKNASKWPSKERMIIGRKLKEASDIHGVEKRVPYSREEMSKTASKNIKARKDIMKSMEDHPLRVEYMSNVEALENKSKNMSDYKEIIDAAERLEQFDKEAGMDAAWGEHVPDPADTFIGQEADLTIGKKDQLTKEASYDNVDFSGLKEKFDESIVNQIAENPEEVIPTLPKPHKEIVEEYINEQRR